MVNIAGDAVFPFHFRVLGLGMILLGLVAIGIKIIASPFLMVIGAFFLFSRYGFQVNSKNISIKNYVFFGFKFGETHQYNSLDFLYITQSTASVRYGWSFSATATNVDYNAYLMVNGTEKYYLFALRNKDKVMSRLKEISQKLDLEIKDYSDNNS